MKKSDLLFALLRKSKNVLEEECASDYDRKFLINLKYEYAKLQPSLRNMIRVMASEIDRFTFKNATVKAFTQIIDGEAESTSTNGKPTLIDKNSGNEFIVYNKVIMSNNVKIFEGTEHSAFIVAFGCLVRAQEHQTRLMKEREIEEQRLNILSEFR